MKRHLAISSLLIAFGTSAMAQAVAPAAPAPAPADPAAAYSALLTPIVTSGVDILGDPLAYPAGAPNVTTAIVTLAPGVSTGWHTHSVPLFAFILSGELTVDYGSKGTKVFHAGDGYMEAVGWPHNGTNTGTDTVQIVAVYMGSDTEPNTTPVGGPQ